jgi:hypothetical protein
VFATTVYRSPRQDCGIRIFNRHLRAVLTDRGARVHDCNLSVRKYDKALSATIVHYVPSMWANHSGLLDMVLQKASSGKTLVLLHGMYGPSERDPRADTPCPDLHIHLSAIRSSAATVISLSKSCTSRLSLWDRTLASRTTTSIHPGLFASVSALHAPEPYAFLGGIGRPKKDFSSHRIVRLVESCAKTRLNIWLHSSAPEAQATLGPPVWRLTRGVMDDSLWAGAIAAATAVLCPYDTKSQCVSGLVAEAVSAGTPVIATAFPFALEMQASQFGHVIIEDDLSLWPNLIANAPTKSFHRPHHNSWTHLVDAVMSAFGLTGADQIVANE